MDLPKAALIDLDDTILDDSSVTEACWHEVCAAVSPRLAGISTGELLQAITRQRDWFWSDPGRHRDGRLDMRAATRSIVERAFGDLGLEDLELAAQIAGAYRDMREERACLIPGAVDTLERLQSQGVRLGMVTNGSGAAQRAKIQRFGLERYFSYILIEGEYGLGKPHPEVYETVLRNLGAEPASAWCVGDNLEWDVGAPQKLGLHGVWVDARRAGLPAGSPVRPDRIIASLAELL